jgi:hypothetical protein
MTTKILWCDRNYDYVESFIEATKSVLPNVQFIIKEEPVDAIKELITNQDQYNLIISGQIFKNMSGTDLFEIFFNNKVQIPFLLLTAQVDYSQFSAYDMWYSFNYMDKLKADFYEVADKIKELVHRDVTATFHLHEKLRDIREVSGLGTSQLAKAINVQESEVINAESDYKKVTFIYLHKIAKYYDLDVQLLIQSEREFLKQKLQDQLLLQKKNFSNIG